MFDKQCSNISWFYCYCLTNNAQNVYSSIIIVWQTMLKMSIVLLLLFAKQYSKFLFFYYHCLASSAQNTYCSIIIVWQTMLKVPIVWALFVKLTIEQFQWLPSECSKHDVMFVHDTRMWCNQTWRHVDLVSFMNTRKYLQALHMVLQQYLNYFNW